MRLSRAIGLLLTLVLAGCGKQSVDHGTVSSALQANSGPVLTVLVEAEALMEPSGVFSTGAVAGAAGGEALLIAAGLAKKGKISGRAKLAFEVPEAARLHSWLRVKWTGTCSNSVIVKAPGLPPKIVGESATYGVWHWVQGPAIDAPAGELVLALEAREDGIFVDQILVTSDLQRVPVGIERAPGSEEQVSQVADDSGE